MSFFILIGTPWFLNIFIKVYIVYLDALFTNNQYSKHTH